MLFPLETTQLSSLRCKLRLAVLAAAVSGACIFATQPSRAETAIFKDVVRPHGITRSQTQKDADGRACGASADESYTNVPAFEKCMRKRGWAVAYIKPDSSDTPGATYDDMREPTGGTSRSNAALHADVQACDPTGNAKPGSAAMKRCMLSRGWRLAFVIPNPPGTTTTAQADNTFFDTDTGLECTAHSGFDVCEPPKGTVKYFNSKHQLNCTRTGMLDVCTNF